MKRKLLSLLVLLMTAAMGAWAETVTWNSTNVFNDSHLMDNLDQWSPTPLDYEGITISFSGTGVSSFTPYEPSEGKARLTCFGGDGDSFTFTAPSGKKFTKIEIIDNSSVVFTAYGDWTQPENEKIVWRGTPASTVTLGGSNSTFAHDLNSIVFTLATVVASGYCGDPNVHSGQDVSWTLTDVGVLTISGTGAMADYDNSTDIPWYSYHDDITSVVIENGVTSIGKSAIAGCSNLASVSIPASVTSIGQEAFYGCGADATAMTVTFAEGSTPLTIGDYAFSGANLTSITIPNRVTSIGNYAFQNCTNVTSVSIPASVTSIGNYAFLSCGSNATALTVTFADGSTSMTIGDWAFHNANLTSITIPNRVTSIGDYAFYCCTNLASVYVMATTPPTLGYVAFEDNAGGRKIYVPASSVGDTSTDGTYKHDWLAYKDDIEAFPVTDTGSCGTDCTYTLYGNGYLVISGTGAMADYTDANYQPWASIRSDIKTIVIEDGVTSIGNYSFQNCFHLTSVSIPASVTSIGNYAFASYGTNAAALTVNFAEGTAPMTIGYCAFFGANLTSITIPNRVTSIDNSAFNACNNLASVSIPASVTSIGETAFFKCGKDAAALTVTFAEGSTLTTIGPGAFAESNLTSITIPNRVTRIANNAFSGCPNLETITLNSNPTIGEDAFDNIKDGATVTMNLTANGPVDGAYWTTFYNENYGFTADTNTKIYKAKVNDGKTAVVLTEVADIPAKNAAVLKSSNAAITMTLTTSASGDYTGNELQGADAAMDAPANAYCLTGYGGTLGFYTYTGTIPVNKAYLVVPSSARSFYGFGDNYTTDIDLPEAVVIEDDGPIYDLSGRLVTGQPQKGIYVKNGKKYVIK